MRNDDDDDDSFVGLLCAALHTDKSPAPAHHEPTKKMKSDKWFFLFLFILLFIVWLVLGGAGVQRYFHSR